MSNFCLELCQDLHIPLIATAIVARGESEAVLREARYDKLMKVARQVDAPYVVTAHNQDDQVETLIFRLLRGTAPRGLGGMSLSRPLSEAQWPVLLRPLLNLPRSAIEQYLLARGVTPRLDSTNKQSKYSRNFLRNQIIVPLKERFPALLQNVERFRMTLNADQDCLDQLAKSLYNRCLTADNKLLLSVLDGEHQALIARTLAIYMEEAGVPASFERVNRVMSLLDKAFTDSKQGRSPFRARLSLGENMELLVDKDSILLKPRFELSLSAEEYQGRLEAMTPVPLKMPRPGRSSAITMVPWLNFAVSIEDYPEASKSSSGAASGEIAPLVYDRLAFCQAVNLQGALKAPVVIRPRLPGDHLQPIGMKQPVRLKQYLHANKALLSNSHDLLPGLNDNLKQRLYPVLADAEEVLWVPGLGISERIKGGASATHLIKFLPLSHDLSGQIDPGAC